MNKIEVLIPSWNSGKTLEKCITSILDTIPEPSIILIDNFSTDSTLQIAKKYSATVIQKECNLGEARVYGIETVKGEWFIFVDSDAYLHKDWFTEIMKWKNKFENAGIKLGAVAGENISIYEPCKSYTLANRSKLRYPYNPARFVQVSNALIKTSAAKGFNGRMPVFEDYMLGNYIKEKGYEIYVVKAFADHDYGKTWAEMAKHSRWGGAGMRLYQKKKPSPFKMLASVIYMPVFKSANRKFILYEIFVRWNRFIGYLCYNKYARLKRK